MQLKHRFLFFILGTLGSVCLSICGAIAAEAQTVRASATIAQGATPPPLPPDTPSTDLNAVRAIHQQINDGYSQRAEAAAAAANQRQQARQQQFDDTVEKHDAQAEEDAKQAVVPTRTPFQPETENLAQAATPPPLPPDSPMRVETPPPLPPDSPVSDSPQPKAEYSIVQAPVVSSSQPKSSEKANAKKLNLGKLSFACAAKDGTPTTIAKLNDRELGVIVWTSTFFAPTGFNPQMRCDSVSKRFEAYSKAHKLIYLAIGKLNNQRVLCATSQENGSCGDGTVNNAGLLLTLKPDSNAQEELDQLSKVLISEANTPSDPLKE